MKNIFINKEEGIKNLYLTDGKRKIRENDKKQKISLKIFAGIIILGILLPSLAMLQASDNPRFNIFTPYSCALEYNRDYYLICVKNETKGTNYNTFVSADPGDILTYSVYYHNGINNTIATNTKLRVNIPTSSAASQEVRAYLWADNAENATFNNPLTFSNTVNISSAQTLEYIQNSAQWFPNQTSPLFDSPTPFPYGQSGNEIISGGVNVGDIEGCWEFSGMVNFKVKVSQVIQRPDLTISKTVRNITENEYNFSESTQAKPRQTLEFSLVIAATGNVALANVIVRDELPIRLLYINGSARIGGSPTSDGIISLSGINIGSIAAGSSKSVTFRVNVEREVSFQRGQTNLTNTGFARADSLFEKSDTAQIVVNYGGCNPENNSPGRR
ncbi:MAG: hypothetical protein A2174_00055 [Candidatus Portnoybacteria bacterium RBG_13_41_18]|uniref:DUF11 domain-containing protein n=1 Tax=Candidatus Portnoybacteria bacterium RBG_13_41_18 TaxID=1801991 RepID=A0A1G2FAS1_9BACT|nr:MAG: hypothetical protein A2174_00055 [Candidatus Portnoybacteria bacterium RBG_13_41_18]